MKTPNTTEAVLSALDSVNSPTSKHENQAIDADPYLAILERIVTTLEAQNESLAAISGAISNASFSIQHLAGCIPSIVTCTNKRGR